MSTAGTVLVVAAALLAVLVVAALTAWSLSRVRRLDRLHRRVDAARAGLGAALDRRAETASRIAAVLAPGPGERLRAAARTALAVPAPAPDGRDPAGARERREIAENVLTRELAAIRGELRDTRLAAELAESQQRVVLARRVLGDAVRDTRVLRSRRLVRWFRLYGTAPEPVYFEIAEPEPAAPATAPGVESGPHPTAM